VFQRIMGHHIYSDLGYGEKQRLETRIAPSARAKMLRCGTRADDAPEFGKKNELQ
jgi:hypothetical protein